MAWSISKGRRNHVLLNTYIERNGDLNNNISKPHQSIEGYRKSKASVSEFDTEISRRFKKEEELTYDGSKSNPEDWSEYLKYDPEFQEEFDSIIKDSNFP